MKDLKTFAGAIALLIVLNKLMKARNVCLCYGPFCTCTKN